MRDAILAGEPIPDKVRDAPELRKGLELYFNAYMDLDDERQYGMMGACALPWSSIAMYSQFYGLDEEQTESMLFLVRRMDRANLLEMEKKQPKQPSKVPKPSRRNK